MISGKEYQNRRSRLEQEISGSDLDGFLVGSREGIYYLTGASYLPEERPFFILFHPGKEPVLVVPELEKTHMMKAGIGRVESYTEFPALDGEGWMDILSSHIKGASRIGVEPDMSMGISDFLGKGSFIRSSILEKMRLIKSSEEIKAIQLTAAYADLGMKEIIKASYAGARVVEIFSRSKAVQARVIRETEYDPMESSFLMASWPAPFSSQPHGIPDIADRMGKGPIVALSYLRVNGYGAEVERTYFHQDPTKTELEIFYQMNKARALGISMVRPGASCDEIDQAVYDYLVSKGYKEYILHRTGHGIGLGNHEGPFVARGSRDILEENMVISIEPGIYIPGTGGFRHSDTYLVTEKGCTCLTHYPDSIDDLVIKGAKPLQRLKGMVICKSLGIT